MRLNVMAQITAVLVLALSLPLTAEAAQTRAPVRPTPPVTVRGSCAFAQTEIATSSSFDQSTSTAFVKLKEAGSITFTEDRAGCVAGTFFANGGNDNEGDHVLLQVLLDGGPCPPLTSGYIFANTGQDFSSHAAAFFCGGRIAPGKHTIEVQYASGLGGNVELFQRTLEVEHQ